MRDLDPTWQYGLLAFVASDARVLEQRPIPTRTFHQIVKMAEKDQPYAVAFRLRFYLFGLSHLRIENGVILPAKWLTMQSRDDAIAKGLNMVTAGGLAGKLGHLY